jgi:putative DNA methylase
LEDTIAEIERERLFDVIRELVKWENSNNERVLNAARAEIMRSCNGSPPPVYDPFCGGGSIPLEAQRLGLEAHASDLNPVPVLINKALIEIPPKFAGKPPVNPESKKKFGATGSWKGAAGLAEDIRYYGQWMRDEAEKRIGHLYPKVKLPNEHGGGEATVIAWLWARTVASPNPAAKGAHVPLVRSFWLSTKAGKKAWIEPVVDQSTMTYRFEVHTGNGKPPDGTVSRNGGNCLLTNSPMPLDYIRVEGKAGRLGARLMAIVAEGKRGRIFLPADHDHEKIALSANPTDAPDSDLPEQALGFRVQNYGMTKHRHLFTHRQLHALMTFCDLVRAARSKVADACQNDTGYSDAVATYLAFGCDRLADRGSTLCGWDAGYVKIRNTFGRQTLSMVWDYAEGNPFSDSTGNWSSCMNWVWEVVEASPAATPAFVRQLSATDIPNDKPKVFSSDPPYYDNVP